MTSALAAAALAVTAITPAAAAAKPRPSDSRTLTIGMTQFPSTFSPVIDPMSAKSYILAMVLRPVVTYDHKWRLACILCETLPTIENGLAKIVDLPGGKKGMEVTYTLKPGLKWGDGKPITSHDVKFAWKVGRHPETGVQNREPYVQTVDIRIRDDRTFTLVIDRLRFDYVRLVPDPLPRHLEEAAFKTPKKYQFTTVYDRKTTNPGLYNGPYRIASVTSGANVVLVPNEQWTGKKPFFRRIVVTVIRNTTALEANLLSGDIDYVAGELGLTFDQALGFRKRFPGRYRYIFRAGLFYEHIDLNLDNPILKDVRVRRALLYGVNRQLISDALFQGQQPVAASMVSPLDHVYNKAVKTYPYDPKRARTLLDAAGWTKKPGAEFRTNARGEPLTLTLMTTAGNVSRERIEQVLQAHWRRIGIRIRIRNEPARVFFGTTVRQRKYPAMAMFAWISAPESVPRGMLHSKMIPTKKNNFGGANYTGFSNKEVDSLIEQIVSELDVEKRRKLWHRLQDIYVAELPVLPLYFRAEAYILPKWLRGIRPTGHLIPTTMWVEDWYAVGRPAED